MFQIIVPRLILLLFVTAWLVLALAPLLPCSMWLAELNFKYCQGSTRLFPNVIVRHVIWTVLQSTNIVIQLTYCCAASQEDSIATLIPQVRAPMYYLVYSSETLQFPLNRSYSRPQPSFRLLDAPSSGIHVRKYRNYYVHTMGHLTTYHQAFYLLMTGHTFFLK